MVSSGRISVHWAIPANAPLSMIARVVEGVVVVVEDGPFSFAIIDIHICLLVA